MEFSPRANSTSSILNGDNSPVPACDLQSFNTPTWDGVYPDVSDCINVDAPATHFGIRRRFEMHATFADSEGSACKNCEYRQYVLGYFRGRRRDTGQWDYFPHALSPTENLSPTEFIEDGVLSGGKWMRYGHRQDPPPSSPSTPTGWYHLTQDSYTPNRATGCNYSSDDAPGMAIPKATYNLADFYLKFRGRIIHMPSETVVSTHEWECTCLRAAP
jgi:hypothetical protein